MTSAHTLTDPARVAEDEGLTIPCREGKITPDAWYPKRDTVAEDSVSGEWAKVRAVKWLCRSRCPLVEHCLDYALETNQQHGIWAGLALRERRKIRDGRTPHPYRDTTQAA